MKFFYSLFFTLLSISAAAQSKKAIVLKADTTDAYFMSYSSNEFDVLIGYNALFNSDLISDSNSKKSVKEYVDSLRLIKDTIFINNNYTVLKGRTAKDSSLILVSSVLTKPVKALLDKGNVKVYDKINKKFIYSLIVRKEGSKRKGEEGIFYRDAVTKKKVFEYIINALCYCG